MRRILVLLTVVALMVGMLAMSVTSAFAKPHDYVCTNPDTGQSVGTTGFHAKQVTKKQGFTDCTKVS
jgi:ABC-type sugar transport system substrate-binding protein